MGETIGVIAVVAVIAFIAWRVVKAKTKAPSQSSDVGGGGDRPTDPKNGSNTNLK